MRSRRLSFAASLGFVLESERRTGLQQGVNIFGLSFQTYVVLYVVIIVVSARVFSNGVQYMLKVRPGKGGCGEEVFEWCPVHVESVTCTTFPRVKGGKDYTSCTQDRARSNSHLRIAGFPHSSNGQRTNAGGDEPPTGRPRSVIHKTQGHIYEDACGLQAKNLQNPGIMFLNVRQTTFGRFNQFPLKLNPRPETLTSLGKQLQTY